MGWKDLPERRENDGFKISHSWQLVNHEPRSEIVKNDITPPQNIREKEFALRNASWRKLELLKQNMCWTSCVFRSIAWRILTSRMNLEEQTRMNKILDEPPWWASGKKMIGRTWSLKKTRLKPCNDFLQTPWERKDEASWRDNRENLKLQKRKKETLETKNFFIMINLRKKESKHLEETRIRIMLRLSCMNLTWWKSMDWVYYLFSCKDWREIWHTLKEVFTNHRIDWNTKEWRKHEWMKRLENEGRGILNKSPLGIENERRKRERIAGKN